MWTVPTWRAGLSNMDEKRANLITLVELSLGLAREAGEVTVEELLIAALEEARRWQAGYDDHIEMRSH